MTSDCDEHSIEDHDLDADGLNEHDWTESVTRVADVALFIMNLYLLYLMFFSLMFFSSCSPEEEAALPGTGFFRI
ncbi:MAG: hypothetical protein BRD51_03495 [Bacteroidetes bacterium SW_11_64_17]|nr:MAG: hypothetical protein BRD51_03495 [Bacteroidetes bacterium SW_11_64_17]